MMTKKIYQAFANAFASIEDDGDRDTVIRYCLAVFNADNPRFDEVKFQEWIRRVRASEDLKGLK